LQTIENDLRLGELFILKSKMICFCDLIKLYRKYSNDLNWIRESFVPGLSLTQILNNIFEHIIEEVSPLSENFFKVNELNECSHDITRLKNLLLDLSEHSRPGNFDLLEVFEQLCSFKNKQLILNVAKRVKNKPHKFLFENESAEWTISTISRYLNEKDPATYKFNLFFFNKTIQNNEKMIPFIINKIGESGIWKYSAEIIETLLERSNLINSLKKFEENLIKFSEILNINNEYLAKIIETVKNSDFNSEIFTILGSKLEALEFNLDSENCEKAFRKYIKFIENNPHSEDKMNLLIAAFRTKHYLTKFSELIWINPKDLDEAQGKMLKSLKNILSNRNLLVFELYCLKVLKSLTGDTLKLNEFCQKSGFNWKINYKDIKIQSNLQIFPIVEDVVNTGRYSVLLIKIHNLRTNSNELDEDIQQPQDEIKTFELGLAFMNAVYLMHTQRGFDFHVYSEWYERNIDLLNQQFGLVFSTLLKFFIYNFPEDSLCFLNENIEESNFNTAMLICYVSLIAVSYSKIPNLFSSQFFNSNGEIF